MDHRTERGTSAETCAFFFELWALSLSTLGVGPSLDAEPPGAELPAMHIPFPEIECARHESLATERDGPSRCYRALVDRVISRLDLLPNSPKRDRNPMPGTPCSTLLLE